MDKGGSITYCQRPDGTIVPVVSDKIGWAVSRLDVRECSDQKAAQEKYDQTIANQKLWTGEERAAAADALRKKRKREPKHGL
jgi:hypothetical protein